VPASSAPPLSPLAQRLFTWTGLLPLGGFLVAHLAVNSSALRGVAPFASVIGTVHRIPAFGALEASFLLMPLAVHGALGGWLVVTRRPFASSSPYPAHVGLAMRVAGVGVVAFLAMHLPEFRWRGAGERLGGHETATLLAADLSWTWHGVPLRGLVYLVGAACAAFHLGAGLWGLLASSSRGRASRPVRIGAAWAIGALTFAIWLGFANVVVMHATGAPLFGGPVGGYELDSTGVCPAPGVIPH
jgi:succinate dehydrogenase cytochrome b subunit